MRFNSKYLVIGVVLVAALIVGLLNDKKTVLDEPILFSEENIYKINVEKNWEKFRKEYDFSTKAKIDSVSFVIDFYGDIEAVKFNLVEKQGDHYKLLRHESCTFCPGNRKNDETIYTKKVANYENFSTLVTAEKFFEKLQIINKQKAFAKGYDSSLYQIKVKGKSNNITYPGHYFKIKENELISLEPPSTDRVYDGFNLQVVESFGGFFNPDKNTQNFIFND